MIRKFLLIGLISGLIFTGCNKDENNGVTPMTGSHTLILNFQGLEMLQNGFHYEGWAIINGQPVSTGKFNVGAGGNLVDLNGNSIANNSFSVTDDLSSATAVVISIEPNNDPDPAPANTHILSGNVTSSSAMLSVSGAASFGNDFSTVMGTYILATPTNGSNTNENSGIWFLDLSSGSPALGLTLPTLPAGWMYEGWAVINGMPVTTGKFTDPAAADNSAPFSGAQAGPPFPGEDFLQSAPAGLTFPTDLSGGKGVITIEPSPDDSPNPFTLKPLVGDIPANATDHTDYIMTNNSAAFPTGSATIQQ